MPETNESHWTQWRSRLWHWRWWTLHCICSGENKKETFDYLFSPLFWLFTKTDVNNTCHSLPVSQATLVDFSSFFFPREFIFALFSLCSFAPSVQAVALYFVAHFLVKLNNWVTVSLSVCLCVCVFASVKVSLSLSLNMNITLVWRKICWEW